MVNLHVWWLACRKCRSWRPLRRWKNFMKYRSLIMLYVFVYFSCFYICNPYFLYWLAFLGGVFICHVFGYVTVRHEDWVTLLRRWQSECCIVQCWCTSTLTSRWLTVSQSQRTREWKHDCFMLSLHSRWLDQFVSHCDCWLICPLWPPMWGQGTHRPPCPFTSSSFPLFTFLFFLFALPIFFCPSLPFLPE